MNALEGTAKAGECARVINADFSCAIGRSRLDMTRAIPEPVVPALRAGIAAPRPSCGGKSILELIWEKLDAVYAELVTEEVARDPMSAEASVLRGEALGLASALAIITNPYSPNLDAIRAEAKARWEDKS